MSDRFLSFYRGLVIERPKLALVIVFLIAAVMAAGLPNFKLDASADALTLEADRDLDYYREIIKRYGTGDLLVVTYRPHDELFQANSLDNLKKLRDELKEIEGVANALSILDVPLLYSPLQNLTQINQGLRTLETNDVNFNSARQEFLTSPIYKNLILGPDEQTTVIALSLEVDEKFIELVRARDALRLKRKQLGLSPEESLELEKVSAEFLEYSTQAAQRSRVRVQSVRDIAEKYKGDAEIFVGGVTMITSDMIRFIQNDLVVFGSAIVVFIIALLAVIFRRIRFVVLPLATSVLSVVIMLGFLSWVDWRLTVISTNFVALLLIVSLAITIHLVVRYREYHAQNPTWSQAELVLATTKFMFKPCLYTTLTTIVAFMSLVVSGIRPVIDFGWMMTIGLLVSFVLVFVVLPAGLMLLSPGKAQEDKATDQPITLIFSRFTERKGSLVLVFALIALGLGGIGVSQLQVDNRFIDYFRSDTEIYQGMKVIDQNLGGTINLDIILDVDPEVARLIAGGASEASPEEDPFAEADPFDEPDPFEFHGPLVEEDPFAEVDPFSEHNPKSQPANSYWFTIAGLRELQSLQNYLNSLDEVGRVDSLATLYEVAEDINGGSLNDFELAVLKNGLPDEIEGILVNPYLDAEINQARVTLRVKETDPDLRRLTFIDKVQAEMVNTLGFKPEQIHFTGGLVLYNNMLKSLFQSQILTLGAVFLAIMVMFMILFRSLLIAVVAIIPNMLAALVILGGMGLAGISLDMMTITIAAITIGIGVDDTIHYIHRFNREYQIDGDYIAAMHRSHASIGSAMYYTSVTIIVGFSVLALSEFIPSILFGLLTGAAMLAAILGALTLLPKLILVVKPFARAASAT
ncbi:efflux RND transporter permease subunit [Sessilibacter corallicola]|uniref:efflux RND transporter permease subunit n=1 Tax=Sessilibacter corallicola TaxID=2904075 RepID=UPI001E3F8ED1|nr:MMPL family transporter [Sessilibacter corallicola]MCE2028215.1 MMPL family transporter [Sessilibacter corallicola]